MSAARHAASCTIALLVAAGPVLAQPAPNIAGTYRGLMTQCLSKIRTTDCRKGFFVLIELADKVDASRATWENSVIAGSASSDQLRREYSLAVAQLADAVADFNHDMARDIGGDKGAPAALPK